MISPPLEDSPDCVLLTGADEYSFHRDFKAAVEAGYFPDVSSLKTSAASSSTSQPRGFSSDHNSVVSYAVILIRKSTTKA